MENEKTEKMALAKEGLKNLDELEASMKLEDIIKDNKIEFDVKGKTFRVKRPNIEELTEIEKAKRKKYTEYMMDDSYLFKAQWIEKYKLKGIDIEKMEDELRVMHAELEKVLMKLATTTDETVVKKLKDEITELRDKQYNLSIKITDLLVYCIENQIRSYTDSYSASVVLERKLTKDDPQYSVEKDANDWVRHFKTYDEFEESEDMDLVSKTVYYQQYLMYNEE